MTRHRWGSLAASRTWPSGSWSASVIFNWARQPLKPANAKFACVTLDRASAGSDPSFQTAQHLPQTAFHGGGRLPPNSDHRVKYAPPREVGDHETGVFLGAAQCCRNLLLTSVYGMTR